MTQYDPKTCEAILAADEKRTPGDWFWSARTLRTEVPDDEEGPPSYTDLLNVDKDRCIYGRSVDMDCITLCVTTAPDQIRALQDTVLCLTGQLQEARESRKRWEARAIAAESGHPAYTEIAEYEALQAKLREYEGRLEITHYYDGEGNPVAIPPEERANYPDGITCRDATIEALEKRVRELEDKLFEQEITYKGVFSNREKLAEQQRVIEQTCREIRFLIDRLRDFEQEIDGAAQATEWLGHVVPSISRLEAFLSAHSNSFNVSQDILTKSALKWAWGLAEATNEAMKRRAIADHETFIDAVRAIQKEALVAAQPYLPKGGKDE